LNAATGLPRAILFDWDNTLVDTWETIHAALVVTLKRMGHPPWTLAETKQRVSHSLKNSFPKLFGARWNEARQIYIDSYAAIHLDRLVPAEGAEDMLEALTARGLLLGVVSNKTGASLRIEAAHLGWSRYFTRLVGAGDASADKPDPAGFVLALAESGVKLGPEVWYVGDTGLDMESATRAGITGVLLGAPHGDPAELAKFPPALRFPGCAGFANHLAAM
jgi:phosphoglycolate phosphatase